MENAICAWCVYARDRDDICGIYCTGGFVNDDGGCDNYEEYTEGENDDRGCIHN